MYARATTELFGQVIRDCSCALKMSRCTCDAASISFCDRYSVGFSLNTSTPRAISEPKMNPLNQYVDQKPPVMSCLASMGPRSKNAISMGCAESVKSNTDTPP